MTESFQDNDSHKLVTTLFRVTGASGSRLWTALV